MKKIILPALVALVLVGCNNVSEEKVNPEKLFKDEIAQVLNIENVSNKPLITNMSSEIVVDAIDKLMQNEYLKELYANYGVEAQGIGTNTEGNRVFCYKFPVDLSFEGTEQEIKELVHELENIPYKINVSSFNIENKDDKFRVTAKVNFLGDIESTSVSTNSSVNLKKNNVDVNEEEQIKLRDFDVNLTLRPSNSDSSAVMIGVRNSKNCLYSDENSKHDLKVEFTKQNGKFYAEYSINDGHSKTEAFSSNGDIKFDILSCKKLLDEDNISVDLTVDNKSGKKVSIIVYNDSDSRVNLVSSSGNVELVNK